MASSLSHTFTLEALFTAMSGVHTISCLRPQDRVTHQTVTHSLHFIDPLSGAHTQRGRSNLELMQENARGTNYPFEAFRYISPRIYVEKKVRRP